MSTFEPFNPSEISMKLADISRVMADGFHFIHMRALVEDWQARADAGDKTAQDAVAMVEKFHRLCVVVEKM